MKCGSKAIQMYVGRDRLCINVVMPHITRGHTWLFQPLPVSMPNTGRNLSNSDYRGLDEALPNSPSMVSQRRLNKTFYCIEGRLHGPYSLLFRDLILPGLPRVRLILHGRALLVQGHYIVWVAGKMQKAVSGYIYVLPLIKNLTSPQKSPMRVLHNVHIN